MSEATICITEEPIAITIGETLVQNVFPGGATDHGSLTGLLDNDHPQYLQTAARLAEFDTEQAKIEARQSLGLQVIDGGTF